MTPMRLCTSSPDSSFPNLCIFYLALQADAILLRCSCIVTFPHQHPAVWRLVLTWMGREAVVLTGTKGNTFPQQLSISLTLFVHALYLSTTWNEHKLPRKEVWGRETAYEEIQTRFFFSSLQHQTAVVSYGQWAKPETCSYCSKYIAIFCSTLSPI